MWYDMTWHVMIWYGMMWYTWYILHPHYEQQMCRWHVVVQTSASRHSFSVYGIWIAGPRTDPKITLVEPQPSSSGWPVVDDGFQTHTHTTSSNAVINFDSRTFWQKERSSEQCMMVPLSDRGIKFGVRASAAMDQLGRRHFEFGPHFTPRKLR